MNSSPELMVCPLFFNQVTVRAIVTPVILQERVAVVPEPTSCPAIVTPKIICIESYTDTDYSKNNGSG